MSRNIPHICIIAGESSGDALGAKLMTALQRRLDNRVRFSGVGGERMIAEGFTSLFPITDIALMGFVEILPHIPRVWSRIRRTVAAVRESRPDIVITIDSPGFNLRVAQKLQNAGIPLIHYVAPTVWAYRPERAKAFAELFDHILLLLPFEQPYFDAVEMPNSFIGHPVIEDWQAPGDRVAFRRQHNVPEHAPLVAILPGSREGEIKRHMPVFRGAVDILKDRYPGMMAVAVATPEMAGPVMAGMSDWTVPTLFVSNQQEKRDAFAAADIAIAKSGTVALEVALAGLPMVVTYKANPFSVWAMRKMLQVRFVNLINLLHRREVVPELIQEFCRPDLLANTLDELLEDPRVRQRQMKDCWTAMQMLGLGASEFPSDRAAEVVLSYLGIAADEESLEIAEEVTIETLEASVV